MQHPAPVIEYGTPQLSIGSGHSSSSSSSSFNQNVGHQSYGVPQPQQQIEFGPPESSYGPPPSGAVFEDSRHGHAANIHTAQSIGTELQLPETHSNNIPFSNDINIGVSALGVSAGNSEVIQSHAIHESHTSEVS